MTEEVKKNAENMEVMSTLLGGNYVISEAIVSNMEKNYLTLAETEGEKEAEAVLENVKKEIEKIKDPQFKCIIATLILARCPINTQLSTINLHEKFLKIARMLNLSDAVKENPKVMEIVEELCKEDSDNNE